MSGKKQEPKIVPAVVTASGFTPCPDVLVDAYSHTTALVWGKVWRYSNMADGVCRASILRLAAEMNVTSKTIANHIKILEADGYIKDTTPDVRNKPHVYVDTGKLRIKIALEMSDNGGTEILRSRYGNFTHEESTTNGARAKSKIFAAYEQNISALTAVMAEILIDAEQDYPEAWILEAIGLAVQNNKRNWRYCETILKRWKDSGKDEGKGKPAPTLNDALKKAGYDA
jgi:DnaD/phage-associated family protein